MILSILIPTLIRREHVLSNLLGDLNNQIDELGQKDKVEILLYSDNGYITTGQKRNELKKAAKGEYIIYLDDDDEVPSFYIEELIQGALKTPDCIVFNGYMTTNGKSRVNFIIRLGEKYEERKGIYYRYPNHICALKRELVLDINFPEIMQGEDYKWATQIKDLGILKTQHIIAKDMYHYRFLTKK